MNDSQEKLFRFVKKFLDIVEVPYQEVPWGIMEAYCPTNTKGWFGETVQGYEKLSLVFSDEMIPRYPGAEMITPGSFRLHWLIQGLDRGKITRQLALYDFDMRELMNALEKKFPDQNFDLVKYYLTWEPTLIAGFKITCAAEYRLNSEFKNLGLNLSRGNFYPDILFALEKQNLSPEIGSKKIAPKKIRIKNGYAALVEYQKICLRESMREIILAAVEKISAEQEKLEEFFREQGDPDSYRLRLGELLWRSRLQITSKLVNLGLIYLPAVHTQVYTPGGLICLCYSPVLATIETV
ncbi:MAG: YqhG family protein [Bacillota bacterium]